MHTNDIIGVGGFLTFLIGAAYFTFVKSNCAIGRWVTSRNERVIRAEHQMLSGESRK